MEAAVTAVEGDWEFDEFDDGSIRIVRDVQLRKYREFLEEHATQLMDIEDALDESLGDSWDIDSDPITLDFSPFEHADVLELVRTDNRVFNKVVTVFVALGIELDKLKQEAESTFFGPLLLYGEGGGEKTVEEGDAQVQMGKLLPFLQRLSVFVGRVNLVVKNVVQQLANLYCNTPTSQAIDVADVHMPSVFRQLGEILIVLATIDEIIAQNQILKEHWTLYKRMLKSVKANTGMFGTTKEQLQPFEKFVVMLEGQLLESMLFQNCIEQCFDDNDVNVTQNAVFRDEFAVCVRLILQQIENNLGEQNERDERRQLFGLCGLFVMFNHLFRVNDKKMAKAIWDMQKKVPAVHLYGTVIISPNEFLDRKLPQLTKAFDKKGTDSTAALKDWLARRDASIAQDAQSLYMSVVQWMIRMENPMPKMPNLHSLLNVQCAMIIQGVLYAYQIRHYITTFMNLHLSLAVPMNRTHVKAIFRLTDLLKAIQQTYYRRSLFVANSMQHVLQHVTFSAITLLQTVRKRVSTDKKPTNKTLDILAALTLMQTAINGPNTIERRLAVNMSLHVASQNKVFTVQEAENLFAFKNRLEAIASLRSTLATVCDSSFLFWHRTLLELHLSDLYEQPTEAHRLHYVFNAFRDCIPMLKQAQDTSSEPVLDMFRKEVEATLEEKIIKPLCRDIETDLRLQVHEGVVQTPDRNPFKTTLQDLTHFLKVSPIRFFDTTVDIAAKVTHYLDTTFYNLTTVALHDWKSYGQMSNLAERKYGLMMQESYLPSQTLEQGLDVLEIMRHIHVFVARYLYNLNNQIFVEKSSKNKFLNTINIRHVANSIRTHGMGIMNTTVNFTYQFLRRQFFIFSQFLFDDHIKSRLIKDVRYFKEIRDTTDQQYPYERAEKFTKLIRKLGVNKNDQTYLDQFRQLITQIGNAMGYIRMIRSGGLNMCSNAIRFVPDIDNILPFEEYLKEAAAAGSSCPDETLAAAKSLDLVVESLTKNFAEGTDYFKMLASVFAKQFRSEKNAHLKNFHVIVPPLTINFLEHIISAKDKISKKNKTGAAFTDDGFAMGVAYILKLLDQYEAFDSLHWFKSVKAHFAAERAKVADEAKKQKDDDKLQEAMSLSLKRIARYEREMDLLFFSLSSARIFFRADQTAAEEKAAEDEKKQEEDAKTAASGGAAPAAAAPAPAASSAPPPPPPPAPSASGFAPPPPPPPLPNF